MEITSYNSSGFSQVSSGVWSRYSVLEATTSCFLDSFSQSVIKVALPYVELGNNIAKAIEYFVLLQTCVFVTQDYNIMDNSEGLIGTTEYLTV